MTLIPTESLGSIPRPEALMNAQRQYDAGQLDADALEAFYDAAVRETITELEATGSPIITDGEQRKAHGFATYSVEGNKNFTLNNGFVLAFIDGHSRQWPQLTKGPFRFACNAYETLAKAKPLTHLPMKQAIISTSALSLFYPPQGIPDYPRETFINDLINEQEKEIRGCFAVGAEKVQMDFTEGLIQQGSFLIALLS